MHTRIEDVEVEVDLFWDHLYYWSTFSFWTSRNIRFHFEFLICLFRDLSFFNEEKLDEIQHKIVSGTSDIKNENSTHDYEGYLNYLDHYFKPEINLRDESDNLSYTPLNSKWSEELESEQTKPAVNLHYRGQKNLFSKGKYSERRDVIYKTLMRSLRRFLLELFLTEAEFQTFSKKKSSIEYYDELSRFYLKHVKSRSSSCILLSQEQEAQQIMYLGALITSKCTWPNKTENVAKFSAIFKDLTKTFSPRTYAKFFLLEGVSELFNALHESRIVEEMIEAYPKMKESNSTYIEAVKTIINFKSEEKLLR